MVRGECNITGSIRKSHSVNSKSVRASVFVIITGPGVLLFTGIFG